MVQALTLQLLQHGEVWGPRRGVGLATLVRRRTQGIWIEQLVVIQVHTTGNPPDKQVYSICMWLSNQFPGVHDIWRKKGVYLRMQIFLCKVCCWGQHIVWSVHGQRTCPLSPLGHYSIYAYWYNWDPFSWFRKTQKQNSGTAISTPLQDQFYLHPRKTPMEVVRGFLSTGFDPCIEAPPCNVAALWPRGSTFPHVETTAWILRGQWITLGLIQQVINAALDCCPNFFVSVG